MEESEQRDVSSRSASSTGAVSSSVRWASGQRIQAVLEGAWKVEVKEQVLYDGTVVRSCTSWIDKHWTPPARQAEVGRRAPKRRGQPDFTSPLRRGGKPCQAAAEPSQRSSTSAQRRSAQRSAAHHARRPHPAGPGDGSPMSSPGGENQAFHDARDDGEPSPVRPAAATAATSDDPSKASFIEPGAPAADTAGSPGKRDRSPAIAAAALRRSPRQKAVDPPLAAFAPGCPVQKCLASHATKRAYELKRASRQARKQA